MEPTLGELARAIGELRGDTRECTERVGHLREQIERRYLRIDLADEQHRTFDVQLQGIDEELHSLHKRLDAAQETILKRVTDHDIEHEKEAERRHREQESRLQDRKRFGQMLIAAILSPVVTAVLTVLIVLTLGPHK